MKICHSDWFNKRLIGEEPESKYRWDNQAEDAGIKKGGVRGAVRQRINKICQRGKCGATHRLIKND